MGGIEAVKMKNPPAFGGWIAEKEF